MTNAVHIDGMARELADQVIAFALSELTDLLPDGCISETVRDDARFAALPDADRDRLFAAVYERVDSRAATLRAGLAHRHGEVGGPTATVPADGYDLLVRTAKHVVKYGFAGSAQYAADALRAAGESVPEPLPSGETTEVGR
jgi:hypothetical protein